MNKAPTLMAAVAFALLSASAFADDKTAPTTTAADQAKMKQEADARKAAYAKMTPEEKAAAQKAERAKKQKQSDALIKSANPDAQTKGQTISKSAAESKAGPAPGQGTMNTPEADKALKQQKGQ